MMRFIKLIVLVPIAIILVVLSVANRHFVTLALNPFRPDDALLSVSLPLFVFLFIALMAGVILGSLVTWFAQGKYRKQARDEAHEARKWREEAGKQRTRVEEITTRNLISASK
ncbi:LapA family protein [Rhizobium sp. TH2]|uniref:LapA family protein n=1 Tax=Rhizobium sp. TH2 TaxID=2775403 RepID=UPI002156FCB1|nr:LapA family protein [Rhizobium sp. TH2]UVC09091.1 LapA family protein [Rhizobium sp. TH2]